MIQKTWLPIFKLMDKSVNEILLTKEQVVLNRLTCNEPGKGTLPVLGQRPSPTRPDSSETLFNHPQIDGHMTSCQVLQDCGWSVVTV